MKHSIKYLNLVWLMGLLMVLNGCSTTLVAPYDPQIRMLLVRSSVEIEEFWLQMQQTPVAERQFSHFSQYYQKIDIDLKVLLKLNQMRANNEDSTKQVENLLALWQQDIDKHKQKDSFKDFLLKRRVKEYQRMFSAMLVAENAKKM